MQAGELSRRRAGKEGTRAARVKEARGRDDDGRARRARQRGQERHSRGRDESAGERQRAVIDGRGRRIASARRASRDGAGCGGACARTTGGERTGSRSGGRLNSLEREPATKGSRGDRARWRRRQATRAERVDKRRGGGVSRKACGAGRLWRKRRSDRRRGAGRRAGRRRTRRVGPRAPRGQTDWADGRRVGRDTRLRARARARRRGAARAAARGGRLQGVEHEE